jgi:UDP-glucose 4-epimerase
MKNILVTGGAGFVGSNLIQKLCTKNNVKIWSLDDYSTGKEDNHVRLDNVCYIKGHTKLINTTWFTKQIPNIMFDTIFHFGEYSRVEPSLKEIKKAFDSNSIGTFEILEYCKKNNSKLIYSASSTKFGDGGANINKSPYAFFKSKNVELIKNYNKWYNLDYKIAYFYNVYGPGQIEKGDYATVIGIFERQFRNSEALTVVSPGTQKRDFTHIDDIISGVLAISTYSGEEKEFCLGSGNSYSILDVAKMFGSEIVFLPERTTERMSTEIDLTGSKKELNWEALMCLKKYIEKIKNNSCLL